MEYLVTVISIDHVTHDVLRILTERPDSYSFVPGQATEVAINRNGWKDQRRPFTFTCLPGDHYLEFVIKTYPSHKGVTNELLQLKPGDSLMIHEVFGSIAYRGEGLFVAGGAGITPFISIFRLLAERQELGRNKLIFANKTKHDIIMQGELHDLLGTNFINILSEDKAPGYAYGQITEEFLKPHLAGHDKVYLCGPEPMMNVLELQLGSLGFGSESIIKENF